MTENIKGKYKGFVYEIDSNVAEQLKKDHGIDAEEELKNALECEWKKDNDT